jgi:hypothetical protein
MAIRPEFLGAAIEMVLGRRADADLIADLAQMLDDPLEVLPWLVLRQGAFAGDSAIVEQLHALAAVANRASPARPWAGVVVPEVQAMDRMLEQGLRDLIADGAARTDLTDTIGSLLHRRNAALSGGPGYEFRRRIVEPGPEMSAVGEEPGL